MGSEATVATAVILLGPVLSLAALWQRHRYELRAERERRRYLLAATALPPGSRIHEQRGDGSQLILIIGPTRVTGDA
jgi:hypothetical protein